MYWCTADTGWITGHSYSVYGPLSNGTSIFIYEGTPIFPDAHRWWALIEKYKISKFYTAPTVIRLFMKEGDSFPAAHDLSSLKILGTVGEPISSEAWLWFAKHVGHDNCPVIDTWWQTETGGHMVATLPSLPQKPGRAGRAFLGIEALVVNDEGKPVPPNTTGNLVIRQPWPGALRTCWNNPDRYQKYWKEIEPYFLSGDLAQIDEDGYIQVLGRSDDVLKVSGVRIGSAEVEGALGSHPSVAEAAVIGVPDEVKGEHIKAFVILKAGFSGSDELIKELRHHVRSVHSHNAEPDEMEFVDTLPKTRSGKIVRRILRAKALGQDPGDISTLED
jgi:acetyl-CoA synthetase